MKTQEAKYTMRELAERVVENDNLQDAIAYLKYRWEDEKEYEDINEYKTYLGKYLPDVEIDRMLKRPFGFVCKCKDGELQVVFKVVSRDAGRVVFKPRPYKN